MRLRKVITCIISMMVLVGSCFQIMGQAVEIKTLTLDEAIKKSLSNNIAIGQAKRNDELYKAQLDQMWNQGQYGKNYQQLSLNKEYNEKNRKVLEEKVIYDTSTLFNQILLTEKNLELLEKNIVFQKKQMRKLELQVEKGIKGKLDLEKSELELKKNLDTKASLKDSLNSLYSQLNTNMGTAKNQQYVLEKEPEVYDEYTVEGDIERFIHTRVDKHLSVWKAEEQMAISNTIDIDKLSASGGNYVVYLEEKAQGPNAEDVKKQTEEGLEAAFRAQHAKLMQLEKQYGTKQEELKVMEKDLRVAEIYYEKGMISQLEYEGKVIQYESLKLQLEEIINEHEKIKVIMEKPYLLSI